MDKKCKTVSKYFKNVLLSKREEKEMFRNNWDLALRPPNFRLLGLSYSNTELNQVSFFQLSSAGLRFVEQITLAAQTDEFEDDLTIRTSFLRERYRSKKDSK